LRDETNDEARASGDEKNASDAGGLAARAAALLDAGAADAWLSTRAGVPKKEDIASTARDETSARETPKANDANGADDANDAEEKTASESFSRTPMLNAGRSASASGSPMFASTSSPLTPAERMASDPMNIHSLAKRATAEMATLRGELESERAATRQYKAELFRLRKNAETRVAAGVAAVTSAADSAKDAAAIRADVIKRATAAEGHAAAFYRRAIEAERLLQVERDRNNSLVAALNAAGTAAAEATRALSERAEHAELLAKELEAKVSEAEARADEAMGIARAATRNAEDTARAAGLDGFGAYGEEESIRSFQARRERRRRRAEDEPWAQRWRGARRFFFCWWVPVPFFRDPEEDATGDEENGRLHVFVRATLRNEGARDVAGKALRGVRGAYDLLGGENSFVRRVRPGFVHGHTRFRRDSRAHRRRRERRVDGQPLAQPRAISVKPA
jgi:hypothetical protein